jgi:ubiquinone/menaquinone biosynthesis C-methylase UbiE
MIITKKQTARQEIIRYFEGAGLDYYYWDKAFNMHFGYFRRGMNPLDLHRMLDQMNLEVLKRLRLKAISNPSVLDLGCGLGAASRSMAKDRKDAQFLGFTITPWQVTFGNQLSREEGLDQQVTLYQSDYTDLPLADSYADAAFAIESACYAGGRDKLDLIREMHRVLKSGGRFVITDGFRKHTRPLPGWLNKVYQKNLKCWALQDLADLQSLLTTLRKTGFKNIQVEDASWRVAPSFAHIPWVSFCFYWDVFRKGELFRLDRQRLNNALAPALGMIMGLSRRHFGYYIITGEKE